MADETVDLAAVVARAEEFRKTATALSDRIVQFERWLASFPSKFQSAVEFWADGEHYLLALERYQGHWGLIVHAVEHDKSLSRVGRLTEGSVPIKTAAAQAFPRLVNTMMEDQSTQTESLRDAIAIIDGLIGEGKGEA